MPPDFLTETGFASLVREMTMRTLEAARLAWPAHPHIAGFAYNCSSAWGDLHISLSFRPERAAMEPPDWEHEVVDAELPALFEFWQRRYEPLRLRYEAGRAAQPELADAFLDALRRVLVGLERDGVFAAHPGIRLLVTEVDADADAEQAALERVRAESA
jgi:hypothetical protein